MPTFSDRLTLNTAVFAAAMFLTALVLFRLGPFAPEYPMFYRSAPTVTEYRCDRCGKFSHFTGSQIPKCRHCQTQLGE